MTTFSRIRNAALLASLVTVAVHAQTQNDRAFLTWTRQYAESLGRSMRQDGRVGGAFDFRVVHTEHSYNYKLRATWLTPEVIRATARLAQLSGGLSDEETNALIREAELPDATVILVEIDPQEGSGVIPLDWVALMRPKGSDSNSNGVRGTSTSRTSPDACSRRCVSTGLRVRAVLGGVSDHRQSDGRVSGSGRTGSRARRAYRQQRRQSLLASSGVSDRRGRSSLNQCLDHYVRESSASQRVYAARSKVSSSSSLDSASWISVAGRL